MFITSKRNGCDRTGQQFASGLFLILVQPKPSNKYPMHSSMCIDCGRDRDAHEASRTIPIPTCDAHGVIARLIRQRAEKMRETTDEEIIELEKPVAGCEACIAHIHAIALVGCTNFRPTYNHFPIRALVRHVSLTQCGHFMMGRARVHGESLIMSGAYGADGLPDRVSDSVYDRAVPLPNSLYELWAHGNGWNDAGSEATAMREWALSNLKTLRA